MTEQIALTLQWKKRLDEINNLGIENRNLKSDSIDITRNYDAESFEKLVSDEGFLQKQITWLSNRVAENQDLNCRFLLKLPNGLDNNNELRDLFLSMQDNSGIETPYVFCSSDENEDSILDYINNLNSEVKPILVLPMSIDGDVLSNLIQKSLDEEKFEIIFFYDNWEENIDNFNYVVRLAERIPDKFHIAFVPVDVNKYGDGYVLSTILIAKGFRSLSLTDTPFKRFFNRWVGNRQKSIQDKINESRWIKNTNITAYEEIHPSNCGCFGINPNINHLAEQLGIKPLVIFHNLEVLSESYRKIKQLPEEKEKALETQEAKIILTTLNLA